MPDELAPVEPSPIKPGLPGTVVLRPSDDELIDAIAADLLIHAASCVRSFGDFHLALSGGSTPLPLYRRMMYDPAYRHFPWRRTHLWIVDERRVSFDDDRSNFREINELIVQQADIPSEQVHPIHAMEDEPDELYERELAKVLFFRERGHDRLDYALLGMGADGHTASLFPRSPALLADLRSMAAHQRAASSSARDLAADDGRRMVRVNQGPNVTPPDRVTMTLPMLNAARFVSVMVTGAKKREMIARVAAGSADPADLPIRGVRPLAGELRWYLDHDACPV